MNNLNSSGNVKPYNKNLWQLINGFKSRLFVLACFTVMACTNNADADKEATPTTEKKEVPGIDSTAAKEDAAAPPKNYSNQRFKEVSVQKLPGNKFRVRGKGQIFEANFNWVVEDGHEEIMNGYEMTSAGAPEWGDFDFTITAEKKRPNSTLTLVLFEISAKDGSRQHELPIPLY